jgi:hypothetical protein
MNWGRGKSQISMMRTSPALTASVTVRIWITMVVIFGWIVGNRIEDSRIKVASFPVQSIGNFFHRVEVVRVNDVIVE